MIIKRVGPLSCAKIVGVLYGAAGFFIGCIFALGSLIGGLFSSTLRNPGFGAGLGMVGAVAFPIVLPILYGGIGFVSALIGAWLYNMVAGFTGGIEMEVE